MPSSDRNSSGQDSLQGGSVNAAFSTNAVNYNIFINPFTPSTDFQNNPVCGATELHQFQI